MRTDYHRWYSHRLGRELGIVVYGHWGPPLLTFPTSGGDEWEMQNMGIVAAPLFLLYLLSIVLALFANPRSESTN